MFYTDDWVGVVSPLPEDERPIHENRKGESFFIDTYSVYNIMLEGKLRVLISGARVTKAGKRHGVWKANAMVKVDDVPDDIRKLLVEQATTVKNNILQAAEKKVEEINMQTLFLRPVEKG